MKKLKYLSLVMLVLLMAGCGCQKKPGEGDIPEPTPGGEGSTTPKFNYEEVMFDNPSEWPTDAFFSDVPAVASGVDDLVTVATGDDAENIIYTMVIKEMDYPTFRAYTDRLLAAGYTCSRAGYWLPDREQDLSNNYSQCEANAKGVYLKATWFKNKVNGYQFIIQLANYDMSAQ